MASTEPRHAEPVLFDPHHIEAEKNYKALLRSRRFLMVYPGRIDSGCLVEAGVALAKKIPSLYFNRNHLPFNLIACVSRMDADMDLNLIMSVASELRKSGKKIAVAESLTSGLIQNYLGSASGSSQYFMGGLTCYSMESKIRILGVPEEFVLENEAVNPQVAIAMAQNVASLFNADIGIGTTGFAEASRLTSIPYAYFCVALPGRTCLAEKIAGPELARNDMRMKVAERALLDLVEALRS